MSTETTTTPVDLLPLKRYEMDPDRVEVRTSIETADLRIEVSVEGSRTEINRLRRRVLDGVDAAVKA